MITEMLILSVFWYLLLVVFAYWQVHKIIAKYSKYPHLDGLPNEWKCFIREDKHKWDYNILMWGCLLRFPLKMSFHLSLLFGAAGIILFTLPLNSPKTTNKIIRYFSKFYGIYTLRALYDIEQPTINGSTINTPIIIANHCCWFDTAYLVATFYPASLIAKI